MKMFITLLLASLLTACVQTPQRAEDLVENSYAYILTTPLTPSQALPIPKQVRLKTKQEAFKLTTQAPPNPKREFSYKYINLRTDYITTYEALNSQLKQTSKDSYEERETHARLHILHLQFIADYK